MRQRLFRRLLKRGTLRLCYPDGSHETHGSGEPVAEINLRERSVLRRLMGDPEMAFGEAYMDGDWWPGAGGLLSVFRLYFANTTHSAPGRLYNAVGKSVRIVREANSALRARRNVQHHYDIANDLFREFLDPDMQYSCAYFETDDTSLAEAQRAKCRHIGNKLRLNPGDNVLDIGCGWGGMALYLAREHGVQVTGLTLSDNQYAWARDRAPREGLADRVRFIQQDYRQHEGAYDAIVSVGMFEHVGRPQYQVFFDQVARLLKPGGRSLIHSIGRNGPPKPMNRNWATKYIFPGGYIPSLSEIAPRIENTPLVLSDVEVLRRHYARTLSCWNENFQARRSVFSERLGERFCRMWEFYLLSCEALFRWDDLVVFQLQLATDNDGVPVTRDYLYASQPGEAPHLPESAMTSYHAG